MLVAASNNIILPNATIIPELIAFLIVLFCVRKWVVPPLNRAMEQRQRNISQSLEVIEEAKVRQASSAQEAQDIVNEARQQARGLVDNANRVAEEIKTDAQRRGDEEYNRIVARAEGEIERNRRLAELSLLEQMAGLVVSTAERVVEAEIDPDRHRALINQAIDAVTASAQGPAEAN